MGIKEKFNSILVSLGLRKEEKEENRVRPEDIVYNDNIQGEFFGIPFGATIEEVIEGFAKHNLFPIKDSSTDAIEFRGKLHENGISFDNFSFGGFRWDRVVMFFSNRRFHYIRFVATHNDKVSALRNSFDVLEKLSNIYRMYHQKDDDSATLVRHVGLGINRRNVILRCLASLTPAENIIAKVWLDYYDDNFYTENNEL